MTKLSLLGFGHWARNYNQTYERLAELGPAAVTLELRLLDYTANALLGGLFLASDDELNFHEANFLRNCLTGSEMRAGYVYSRRNKKPLYMVDMTIIPPEDAVKQDINRAANPLLLFPGFGELDFGAELEAVGITGRNYYTARCLDLLAERYGNIAHIGGSAHMDESFGEPLQKIVNGFDDILAEVYSCSNWRA